MKDSIRSPRRKIALGLLATAVFAIILVAAVMLSSPAEEAAAQSSINAPTNLQSTGRTATTVSLNWTRSTTSGVKQYVGIRDVEKYAPGNFRWRYVDANATSYTVRNLEADTKYAFRVRATKGSQQARSNYVNVTTLAQNPDPTATPTPTPTPEPTATPVPAPPPTTAPNPTDPEDEWEMPSLGTVTFTAHDDNKNSDDLVYETRWTENPIGVASMTLWIRPDQSAHRWYFSGTASPSDMYTVTNAYRPDPNETELVRFEHSTVYHVQVRGTNADGDEARQDVGSFRTQPRMTNLINATLPGSTALRHKQAHVSWGNTLPRDFSHFELRINGGRFGTLSTGDANRQYIATEFPGTRIGGEIRSTGYTVTGLQADTQYDLAARVWNTHGQSSFWRVILTPFRTARLPLHPPALAVTDVDHDSATLLWTQGLYVADAGWPTTFQIHAGSNCGGDFLWRADGTGRDVSQSHSALREVPGASNTTNELVPSTRYTFSTKANYEPRNHSATSICSNTVAFNTRIGFIEEWSAFSVIAPNPDTPGVETAVNVISWRFPPNVYQFDLYRRRAGQSNYQLLDLSIGDAVIPAVLDTDVQPNQTYEYKLVVTDDFGQSREAFTSVTTVSEEE